MSELEEEVKKQDEVVGIEMHIQVPNVPDALLYARSTIALFASYVPSDPMCCLDEAYAI
ncbi:hypothetical protein F2Q69_00014103 [Brassica cretica]|uniref:Uncharacterized protein n=1 Tax=Brassica cretica TaxID=69181 RepID=A0A8S9R9I7_BRACR|nr:hypothetical protein F2Q69_00014103 [Brassica cretica]